MKRRILAVGLLALVSCDNRGIWRAPQRSLERMQGGAPERTTVFAPPPDSIPMRAGTAASPLTRAMLVRGQQHYGVFCAPCHGVLGDGNTLVARHMATPPGSLVSGATRTLSNARLAAIVRDGTGRMLGFGNTLDAGAVADVVAYTQALQLSRDTPLAALPAAVQAAARAQLGAP